MTANELMIGDLVSYDDGNYVDYDDVTTTHVVTKILDVNTVSISSNGCESIDMAMSYIEPIPLTEEILLANGFEVTEKDEYFKIFKYKRQDQWVRYKIYHDRFRQYFVLSPIGSCVRIVNVHELQHALRLCGLNEFADNFNVE